MKITAAAAASLALTFATAASGATFAAASRTSGPGLAFTDARPPIILAERVSTAPEAAMWQLLLAGIGLVGVAARRRRI